MGEYRTRDAGAPSRGALSQMSQQQSAARRHCSVMAQVLDTHGPFDLILGADVLYDQQSTGALARVVSHLLQPTRGRDSDGEPARGPSRCMLADPEQRPWRAAFLQAADHHGLLADEVNLPGPEAVALLNVMCPSS